MAYIKKNTSTKGVISHTAQIDLNGVRMKKTFPTQQLAAEWARKEEGRITAQGAGLFVTTKGVTIGDLIRDYIEQAAEKGKTWSPSKTDNLAKLAEHIGHVPLKSYNRQVLFTYCAKMRETRGASGAQERLIYLGTVLKFGRNRQQLDAPLDEHRAGMAQLREDGDIGKSNPRNLNFAPADIEKVKAKVAGGQADLVRDIIDVLQVVPFRISELCAIKWTDLDPVARTVMLRNWEGASNNKGDTRLVTLTMIGDVDTYELIAGRARTPGDDRVFPIDSHTVSNRWSEANRRAGIDMHVHDTRHHAISELFTSHGWDVPAVAHYTGHKDWKVLAKNYGKLAPAQMHKYAARQRAFQAYVAQQEKLGHNGGPAL